MLAKSGNDTFALCLYADEQDSSHHINDAATIGRVGVGNVVDYWIEQASPNGTVFFSYALPGYQSCSMLHIASRSNINVPGLFVFLLEHGTEPYFGTNCSNVYHEITLYELQCQCVKREMSVWFQWAMSMEVVEWRCVWIESGG